MVWKLWHIVTVGSSSACNICCSEVLEKHLDMRENMGHKIFNYRSINKVGSGWGTNDSSLYIEGSLIYLNCGGSEGVDD